jgi:tetratricopeptide (TPR) repeat protein
LALLAMAGSAVLDRLLPVANRQETAAGGWRAVAADVCWLRAYEAWRAQDEALAESLIRRTLGWDPRPLTFWVNGARMMAHDFPSWRAAGDPGAPAAVQAEWRRNGARAAIGLLEEGLRRRGPDAVLLCEIAGHHWHGLGDIAAAAAYYREAALLPGAPWHAGRLHAEALLRLGRRGEAREWLRTLLPYLPATDPAAQRAIVAERLAQLERELARQ